MVDFMGNEVRVGDTILYAGTCGRSAMLVEATVLEVRGERKLKVHPIRDSIYGDRTTGHWNVVRSDWVREPSEKTVVINYPERLVVVKRG